MVAEWAAVANCFGLVVLWRTGLPCKTLSGHWELSLNRRHSQTHDPSKTRCKQCVGGAPLVRWRFVSGCHGSIRTHGADPSFPIPWPVETLWWACLWPALARYAWVALTCPGGSWSLLPIDAAVAGCALGQCPFGPDSCAAHTHTRLALINWIVVACKSLGDSDVGVG